MALGAQAFTNLMNEQKLVLPGTPNVLADPTNKEVADEWYAEIERLTDGLRQPLVDHYLPSTYGTRDDRVFRASEMGHPALEIAYNYFFGKPNNIDEKTMLIFWFGHCFEAWLDFLYERSGCIVVGRQNYHEWNGISGHSDFIIDDTVNEFVADAKAVNARCFNHYRRYGLQDDRGYATQLSIYSEASGKDACIIMMNKETGDVDHAWLDDETKQHCLKRAKAVKDIITKAGSTHDSKEEAFNHCFRYFAPPEPKPEVHKKEYTGRLLPPNNMIHHPLRDILYQTYKATNNRNEEKVYVEDYKYPEGYEQYKPDIEAVLDG